jgi:serine/threonine protein kinase
VKLIYDSLSSLGVAWRDFSPRNILVRSPRSNSYEIILCDFERNSFFGSRPLDEKWKTLIGIFAREEFSNSLGPQEVSTIFRTDPRVFNRQVKIDFVGSRRIKAQLEDSANRSKSCETVAIRDLIDAMQVCYLSALPVEHDGRHLSMLYPLDLLSYGADVRMRLDVMKKMMVPSAERNYLADLLQHLATAATIIYVEDYRGKIGSHLDSYLWKSFGKVCLEILSGLNPAPRLAILRRLEFSLVASGDREWLIPLFRRVLSK